MKNEQTPERKALLPQERGIVNCLEMEVVDKIVLIRNMEVIADADVAALYGVQTKEINQAVNNNPEKFPCDYLYVINNNELQYLRSKILTTNVSRKSRNSTDVRDGIITGNQLYRRQTQTYGQAPPLNGLTKYLLANLPPQNSSILKNMSTFAGKPEDMGTRYSAHKGTAVKTVPSWRSYASTPRLLGFCSTINALIISTLRNLIGANGADRPIDR